MNSRSSRWMMVMVRRSMMVETTNMKTYHQKKSLKCKRTRLCSSNSKLICELYLNY